ncbi:MAG: prenyltransferase/squalene oxidase repeat-containing protein [Bacteroidota bacterium]
MKKYLVVISLILSILAFKKTTDDYNMAAVDVAINKSIPLLQSTSHTFLKNAVTCHSCHGQGLGGVAFALAKEKGFIVDDGLTKEALDSICKTWKSRMSLLVENDDPVAIIMTGNYDLWALSANHVEKNKTIELLTQNIMRRQKKDGSWVSPNFRPPLEYYTFTATALTLKNMQAYAASILSREVEQRMKKASTWLLNNVPEVNEEKAFQLLGLTWSNTGKELIASQGKKLLASQHADGGWSQLDSLETDAYATGQSLYALNQSGQLPVTAPEYKKGIAFLLRTQKEDGSWHIKTRSYPFVPFVDSGFPHDDDQFISAAGSNWATMALVLAADTK